MERKTLIAHRLHKGKDNAISGRILADLLGVKQREIFRAVEHDRRNGQPICASVSGQALGYYMASDPADLAAYCRSLDHRLTEIHKTREALQSTLDRWNSG